VPNCKSCFTLSGTTNI